MSLFEKFVAQYDLDFSHLTYEPGSDESGGSILWRKMGFQQYSEQLADSIRYLMGKGVVSQNLRDSLDKQFIVGMSKKFDVEKFSQKNFDKIKEYYFEKLQKNEKKYHKTSIRRIQVLQAAILFASLSYAMGQGFIKRQLGEEGLHDISYTLVKTIEKSKALLVKGVRSIYPNIDSNNGDLADFPAINANELNIGLPAKTTNEETEMGTQRYLRRIVSHLTLLLDLYPPVFHYVM